MEALSVDAIPEGEEWQYEPKWDGFRCLAFRDGDKIELQSKSQQPLARYFPELVRAFAKLEARRLVLDGEIAVPEGPSFSFDALLQRIHPAASRVERLSVETPAIYIAFDLLADDDGTSLLELPLRERRRHLERFAGKFFIKGVGSASLLPLQISLKQRIGSRTPRPLSTASSRNDAISPIAPVNAMACRRSRASVPPIASSADRYGKGKKTVGSLLLGLSDTHGLLHHVGFTSSIPASDRPELTKKLAKLVAPPGFTGSAPGGPSRWNQGKENVWHPLKPELVIEVCYDHVTGNRFRHGKKLLRWRPDKSPG
jgi:ATP-dependent DNA ligase